MDSCSKSDDPWGRLAEEPGPALQHCLGPYGPLEQDEADDRNRHQREQVGSIKRVADDCCKFA